ncbi:MAG: hypothetical protein IIB41_05700 [Candidatus Marinimicrobia bacterium]|nr:hypothetical protein [Candidatus Neomarinimicrobiota bacterium]
MTVILVLAYIALTRLVMWVFEDTIFKWGVKMFFIILLNAAATYFMYDYIDDQFQYVRDTQKQYYKRYDNLVE